jgi:predicted nucleotidyltransferase
MLPVNTKAELIERVRDNYAQILRFGVKRLGIFGSFVRDKAGLESDVDFFIEFYPEQKSFDNFMDLAFFLESIAGRKIEIVTPQSLSKHIGPHILNEVEYVALAS